MAVAALVLGVLGVVFAILPCTQVLGMILGVIGFILGLVSMNKCKKEDKPKGKSVAGVVLSAIAIVLGIIWLVGLVGTVNETASELESIFEDLDNELDDLDMQMDELDNLLED